MFCFDIMHNCIHDHVIKFCDSRDKFKSNVIWNANMLYYVNISKEVIHESSNPLLLLSQKKFYLELYSVFYSRQG